MTAITWGWKCVQGTPNHPTTGGGITWVAGTLEDAYDRVARNGGHWRLVASVPPSAFHEVMAEQRRVKLAAERGLTLVQGCG